MTTKFLFKSYAYDTKSGTLQLHYAYDNGPAFCETLIFPRPSKALNADDSAILDRLCRLLFLVAGVSYYKAYTPQILSCQAFEIDPATASFVEKLYHHGLAEFSYTNHINVAPRFENVTGQALETIPRKASDHVLVPVGGGKDSIVALECLRQSKYTTTLFAMHSADGLPDPIRETIAISGLNSLAVERRIDPGLMTLQNAQNGHVPITAILSLIALCTSILHGLGPVIMANEHSASAPNVIDDGKAINHQYSKSLAFEIDLDTYLKKHVCRNLSYASLLRPLTEVAIAQKFSTLPQYHTAFRSCNAAFRQDAASRATHWCCDCPKCRFVFLALAAFLEKDHLISLFGQNLLDDPTQLIGFSALCGLDTHKPFECVGETRESALLLLHLSALDDWQDAAIVQALMPRLSALYPNSAIDFITLFDIQFPHHVGREMLEALDAVG